MDVLHDTTWGSKIDTINRKLANLYMDRNQMDAASPLLGARA